MIKELKQLTYLQFSFIFGVTVLSIWGQGYYYGITSPDHIVWMPIVRFFANPLSYPRDLFVHSANDGFFLFWRGIAYLVNIFPQKPLFLFLHVIIRFGIFLLLWLCAKALTGSDYAALTGLSLLATSKTYLAFFALYAGSLTHSALAWLLLIASLYYFLKDNFLLAYIFLAIGFNFNPPLGIQLFLFYGIFFLIERRNWREKSLWLGLLSCLILFIPVALYVLKTAAPANKELLFSLLEARISHHFFPFSWSFKIWFSFYNIILLLLLGLKAIPEITIRKKVYSFLLGMVFFFILGTIFTEYYPSLFTLKLIPFRSHKFIVFIAFLLAGAYFEYSLGSDSLLSSGQKGLILLTWGVQLLYGEPNWLINLCLFFLLSYQVFISYPGLSFPRLINVFFGVTIVLSLLKNNSFIIKNLAKDMAILSPANILLIFLVVAGLLAYHFTRVRYPGKRLLTYVLILLTLFFSSTFSQVYRAAEMPYMDDWIELQDWAREKTAPDSMFITPPYLFGFRVRSLRSSFFDWKDLTSLLWSPRLTDSWYQILKEYNYNDNINNSYLLYKHLVRTYDSFTGDRFIELSQKYKINYAVTVNYQRLPLPTVYRNQTFIVYQLAN